MTANAKGQLRETVALRLELPPPEMRRALRVRCGVSLREMATAVNGVSPQAVLKWERGGRPGPENLAVYVSVLRVLREELNSAGPQTSEIEEAGGAA